jgi:hypothetical protein
MVVIAATPLRWLNEGFDSVGDESHIPIEKVRLFLKKPHSSEKSEPRPQI